MFYIHRLCEQNRSSILFFDLFGYVNFCFNYYCHLSETIAGFICSLVVCVFKLTLNRIEAIETDTVGSLNSLRNWKI